MALERLPIIHLRWEARMRVAFGALALTAMSVLIGCGNDPQPTIPPPVQSEQSAEEPAAGSVSVTYAPPLGSVGLNERVFDAAVIARVKLKWTEATAEHVYTNEDGDSVYRGLLRFTFEVLEYLKGEGGDELVVDATVEIKSEVIRDILDRRAKGELINWYKVDYENPYRTRERAITATKLLERNRDTRWDDREAIIFAKEVESSDGSKRYTFGPLYDLGVDGLNRAWLPSARADGADSAAAGASSGDGRFLLEDPNRVALRGASESSTPSTTSVGELKELKTKLDDWRNAGEGVEGYLKCIRDSFFYERLINGRKERGESLYDTYDFYVDSGLPAGTAVYSGSPWSGSVWLEGVSKDLFDIQADNNGIFQSTRPLPAGEYAVYHNFQQNIHMPCNYYPEEKRNTYEWFVHVAAPEGVLHEAFFDPVTIGDATGAGGGAHGMLKPTSFETKSGSTTTIARIEWESQKVRMEFSPSAPSTGHHVDLIALDGSVALRLKFDDASESVDDDTRTLTWGVCSQPWNAGDKLMLRISESGVGLTGATNDSDCDSTPVPTAVPTATVTPTPTVQSVEIAASSESAALGESVALTANVTAGEGLAYTCQFQVQVENDPTWWDSGPNDSTCTRTITKNDVADYVFRVVVTTANGNQHISGNTVAVSWASQAE